MGEHTFENSEIQRKAVAAARMAPRPKTYNSKKKRIELAKVEIIKDMLVKEGYMDAIRPHMPRITKAMIESASKPTSAGTADRRLIFQGVGIIGREQQKEEKQTAAQMLEQIFANADPNDGD